MRRACQTETEIAVNLVTPVTRFPHQLRDLIVDDTSPGFIYYPLGAWQTGGDDGEYNHTSHISYVQGASTLLTFQGTSVSVFGTLLSASTGTPVSSYTLDKNQTTQFSAPSNTTDSLFEQQFFKADNLEDTWHTLTITLVDGSAFVLDYLIYTPTINASSPTLSMGPYPVPPGSPTQSGDPQGSTPSSSSPSSSSTSQAKTPVGAIIGGVLGGFALIAILAIIIAWLFIRNCRRPRRIDLDGTSIERPRSSPGSINPFRASQTISPVSATTISSKFGQRAETGTRYYYNSHQGSSNPLSAMPSSEEDPMTPYLDVPGRSTQFVGYQAVDSGQYGHMDSRTSYSDSPPAYAKY
ncbi:hypothetical protein AMATHDRAFT_4030 [Amanita thiersii Skay4041]|uniref:Uncharacterized protein n=1 Tax=Amanita thiersii Skay4041 TaxID=703135 RepID=A0A2A9NQ61_9AGAR|nr:hypothetical protein AMATHDRAFT_4030 [Amanita thiersii Skay4041]